MNSNLLKILTTLLFVSSLCFGQQTAKVTPAGTKYLEYLPSDYATSGKNYPLLIFLHGLGERGSDLNKVKVNGPPKLIEQGNKMCFSGECFIVISPLLSGNNGDWYPNYQREIFEHVLANYRIDKSRIYLTGLSLGGKGVYIGVSQIPDIFAAGLVLAGYGNSEGCELAKRLIPIWAIHGEKDGTIQYGNGWTEFMRTQWCAKDKLNITTAEQKWTMVPGAGHDVWTQYYNDPSVYEWLLSKKKGVVDAPPVIPPVIEPPVVGPPVISPPFTPAKSTITIDGKVYEITLTPK
jgi:predicted peptidase